MEMISQSNKQSGVVRVPHVRLEQLRQLAAFHNVTVIGLLERFIDSEITAGNLPDKLPGVSVERLTLDGDTFRVGFEGSQPVIASAGSLASIADALDRIAATGGSHLDLDTALPLVVSRVGGAVAIAYGDDRVFTGSESVARSLARQLRASASSVAIGREKDAQAAEKVATSARKPVRKTKAVPKARVASK